jgi:hypothetical protein
MPALSSTQPRPAAVAAGTILLSAALAGAFLGPVGDALVRAAHPALVVESSPLSPWPWIAFAAVPVAALAAYLLEKRGALRAPLLVVLALAAVGLVAWQAADDAAVLHPLTAEALAPSQPGDAASAAVLMEYSRFHPSAEASAYDKARAPAEVPWKKLDDPEFLPDLVRNRKGVEANWAFFAPQRRWIERLCVYPRIGDPWDGSLDGDIVNFRVWRELTTAAIDEALLKAVDGDGNAGFDTLYPLYASAHAARLPSRSLVRYMIFNIMERRCIEAFGVLLDHARVDADRTGRLDRLLRDDFHEDEVRQLVFSDYLLEQRIAQQFDLGRDMVAARPRLAWARLPLSLIGRVVVNRNATVNAGYVRLEAVAAAADARDEALLKAADAAAFPAPLGKNAGGAALLDVTRVNFSNVVKAEWQRRIEAGKLVARLESR